jgi:hypothetical protein
VLSAMGLMSVDEAFEALRTYARRNNLPLRVVAEGVASRTLDVLVPNAFAPRHKSE